ncbi:MAG: bifunctional riboflavin kinase/FAD synthetase [Kiritimatiellae bacterium]|nr:bifunctional riboflavin kinase/FAD synthetase [Kiritimatiellia bacterium]
MKKSKSLTILKKKSCPIFLAAGFFDGVHLGHRKVIDRMIACARNNGGEAWILSFDTHPLKIIAPLKAPLLLTSAAHKLQMLGHLDLDGCILLPFTSQFADLQPDDFICRLRRFAPTLVDVFVGENWRFGKGGAGTPGLLSKLGRQMGFDVTIVRPLIRGGFPVSSTKIRKLIIKGQLDEASRMLGRTVSILGTVCKGRQIGRQLGFPTANLDTHSEALPPQGVYAVRALIGREIIGGVLNLGTRPTFEQDNKSPLLELHLMDFRRKLYGRNIEVFFVKRLRNERKFSCTHDLKLQIARDIEKAGSLL